MKRLLALILALMCALPFVGCIDFRQRYITEEDGEYYLLLPISKEKIRASHYYGYLGNLDIDLLKKAEEKINDQASQYSKHGNFYLSMDDEKRLCLCMEIIVEFEPPSGGEWLEGGCGIDHEHVFFRERITK